MPELYEGVLPELLARPVNVLRLTLHPGGLAPRLLNLDEWADHLLTRLRRELELTADPRLEALLREGELLHKPATRARRLRSAPHGST